MRILITGAAGFIGSHLVERLLPEHEIYGWDTLVTGRRENLPSGFPLAVEDIADLPVDEPYPVDLIIHCAASYKDPDAWERDIWTNVLGTSQVVRMAQISKARVIYFQTALPPISSYAITKIAGQHFIEAGLSDYVILRLANIYGPRNLSGPIPTFYKRLKAGMPCTVVRTSRDMVFVDDLVDLVIRVIADKNARGLFDVCSGRSYQIGTLYGVLAALLNATEVPEKVDPLDDDVPKMVLDPGPVKERFGWTPQTKLVFGVGEAVSWYDENDVTDTYTHLRLEGR